jgi:hypothetical protein
VREAFEGFKGDERTTSNDAISMLGQKNHLSKSCFRASPTKTKALKGPGKSHGLVAV